MICQKSMHPSEYGMSSFHNFLTRPYKDNYREDKIMKTNLRKKYKIRFLCRYFSPGVKNNYEYFFCIILFFFLLFICVHNVKILWCFGAPCECLIQLHFWINYYFILLNKTGEMKKKNSKFVKIRNILIDIFHVTLKTE